MSSASAECYYRHSNRFPAYAPIVLTIAGLAIAAVSGVVYGAAIYYIPFIYVSFFLTLGLGFGIGWVIYQLALAMHVRNPMLAGAIGLVSGLAADYAAFVSWVFVLSGNQALVLLPNDLFIVLQTIAEQGAWSLFGNDVRGVTLYLVWLAELLLIVGPAAALPFRKIRNLAYCESCGSWLREPTYLPSLDTVAEPDAVREQLEQGDFGALGNMKRVGDEAMTFSQVLLIGCNCDNPLNLFTLRNVTTTYDREGKAQVRHTQIVDRMIIDEESHRLIQEIIENQPASEAGESTESAESTEAAQE